MSKVLKKGALFTDIHFGRRNSSEEHNLDCRNYITWFCDQVKADPEIDHIQFLGDWHEHRAAININTLNHSYEAAKQLNSLGLKIYFISGNHDHFLRNSGEIFSTYHFEAFENFKVMNEITYVDEIMGGVLFVPYINEDEYPKLLEYRDVPVCSGHLELKGFQLTGTSRILEHGPDAADFFKNQKRVFSGHFHVRSNKGNINYIGNCFNMDFSDVNDTERGMAVYDFETDDLKYIDWEDGPQFVRTTLSEVLDNPKLILKKNSRVKIEIDDDLTYEEVNKLRKTFQEKYNLREITLEEKITIDVNLSEDEEAIEEMELETTNEVIQELIKRIKDDAVDTDLLLKIYNDLSVSDSKATSKAANIEFMEMTMRNYLSYGNDVTTINLDFSDPTLIIGRNYDSVVDGNVDSNGSGKSTILNSLLMCIFDKNLMNVDKNGQINKSNGKNMMLTVTFKVDGKYYKVERYRKNKPAGGDGVRLYVNEKEPIFDESHDKTPDSVANANKEIERILGIPYEMFIRIVVFSATHEPFLSLPSSHASKANQRDIIEELFGLTELTYKAEMLKGKISSSKADFKYVTSINEHLRSSHTRHNEQIDSTVVRVEQWDANQQIKLGSLTEQISDLEAVDVHDSVDGFETLTKLDKQLVKIEKNIPVLEAELRSVKSIADRFALWERTKTLTTAELTDKIEELTKIDFDYLIDVRAKQQVLIPQLSALESEIKVVAGDINRITQTTTEHNAAKTVLLAEIEHLNENLCPYCKQKFGEAKDRIRACEEQIGAIDELLSDVTPLMTLNSRKADLELELVSLTEKVAKVRGVVIPKNLDTMKQELEGFKQRLSDLDTATNPHIVDEDALSEDELNATLLELQVEAGEVKSKISMAKEFINPIFKTLSDIQLHQQRIITLKDRISELEGEINPFISVLDALRETQMEPLRTDEINALDKEMKHQEFLLKLLTKKDSFIRKALLNKSIPLLNTRLRHNLDKVGLSHKVQFNESMEVDISQFGSEYEYGNFSSGQKARVNLCLAFAFRDVLQSRFGKINLCILDECLDTGLGNVGVTQAAKMIKSIAIENKLSMFIISHRDEVSSMFDKRLEIELRNGFSAIL